MMNLAKRRKQLSGYMKSYPIKIQGYFLKKCTFNSSSEVITLITDEVWKNLEKLNDTYYRQVHASKRIANDFIFRYPISIMPTLELFKKGPFAHFRNKRLESSFLFRMYCNGFNKAYKYFFSDNFCLLLDNSAMKTQKEAYLDCLKVQTLDKELGEDTKDLSLFAEYCFDLGQKIAVEYSMEVHKQWTKKNKSKKHVTPVKYSQIFKKAPQSSKSDEYIEKLIFACLDYIKQKKRERAKRAAIVIDFLDNNDDIKIEYDIKKESRNSKKMMLRSKSYVTLLWNELGFIGNKNSFIREVQMYTSEGGIKYKIKEKDVLQFHNFLNDRDLL